MNIRRTIAASAIALVTLGMGAANASTVFAQFFSVTENGSAGPDFGVCCSSPPATLPVIALGSGLVGGDPVTTLAFASGGVADQSGTGHILWWNASTAGITSTGSGPLTLPNDGTPINMFAPNSTGNNNSTSFETAILSGEITGTGSDVKLFVSSDDDALVYINGLYVGGNPGVHGNETSTIDLGNLNGTDAVKIFYADRAQTDADFGVNLTGGVLGVPEPATWAMFLVGFGAIGWTLRSRKQAAALA